MSIDPDDIDFNEGFDSEPDESQENTEEAPDLERSWKLAASATVVGILMLSGGIIALLSNIDHIGVQAGAGIGMLLIVVGFYGIIDVHRQRANQRHREVMEAITEIDGGDSPMLGSQAEHLLRTLRTQRKLTKQLMDNLPQQQRNSEELIEELSKRNRAIELLFEEKLESDNVGGISERAGPSTSNEQDGADTGSSPEADGTDTASPSDDTDTVESGS